MLATSDEPVSKGYGIRVSDLIGNLLTAKGPKVLSVIPHFIVVLETCYSGNAASGPQPILVSYKGLQKIVDIQTQKVPRQVVLLSAAADGDNNLAYNLDGTELSAFGYLFTRALDQDWACADSTPDGILTLQELRAYLDNRLDLAYQKGYIKGKMVPLMTNLDETSFIAYSPNRHAIDGIRSQIKWLTYRPEEPHTIAEIRFNNGEEYGCSAAKGCSMLVSALSSASLEVTSRSKPSFWSSDLFNILASVFKNNSSPKMTEEPNIISETPDGEQKDPSQAKAESQWESVKVSSLVARGHAEVAGVSLQIR